MARCDRPCTSLAPTTSERQCQSCDDESTLGLSRSETFRNLKGHAWSPRHETIVNIVFSPLICPREGRSERRVIHGSPASSANIPEISTPSTISVSVLESNRASLDLDQMGVFEDRPDPVTYLNLSTARLGRKWGSTASVLRGRLPNSDPCWPPKQSIDQRLPEWN